MFNYIYCTDCSDEVPVTEEGIKLCPHGEEPMEEDDPFVNEDGVIQEIKFDD